MIGQGTMKNVMVEYEAYWHPFQVDKSGKESWVSIGGGGSFMRWRGKTASSDKWSSVNNGGSRDT